MPPKRTSKKSSKPKGGRSGNVGGMVNQTMTDILRLFLLLSDDGRRTVLEHLSRIAGTEIGATQNSGQGATSAEGTQGQNPVQAASNSKLAAWDRPIIQDLPYAIRQRERSKADRNSDAGKNDGKLISAALAAITRARQNRITDDVIVATLSGIPDDETTLAAVRVLWPSQRRVEAEARAQPEDHVQEQPEQAQLEPLLGEEGDSYANWHALGAETLVTEPPAQGIVVDTGGNKVSILTNITSLASTEDVNPPELRNLDSATTAHLFGGRGTRLGGASTKFDGVANLLTGVPGDYRELVTHCHYSSQNCAVMFHEIPKNWHEVEDSPRLTKRKRIN